MEDNGRIFSAEGSVYIIAELANAAQGVVEVNFELIAAAKDAGADAVKFQLYKYDELTTPAYPKYEIYKRTFYSLEDRTKFITAAADSGLDVWVDVFDRWGLEVAIANKSKLSAVKIPPTVILDRKLVTGILKLDLPTTIGVGGYEDKDIDFVLGQLAGFDNPILLMYGYQGFPTPLEETSLARIAYLRTKYGYPIGFADHVDAELPAAMTMPEYAFFAGAGVIEKHITLSRADKGLDYYSALQPHEFKQMVDNLRTCAAIRGTTEITSTQKDYLEHATRITTTRPVNKGQFLSLRDIKFRRTDNKHALLPNQVEDYFPAVVRRDIEKDAGLADKDIRKAVAAVIAVCRLHSTRLPDKALLDLAGVNAIHRCLLNTLESKLSTMTVLATSTHPDDDRLQNYTLDGKVRFFRGSENDVAARLLEAAEQNGIDVIVRVTGDSPLISYELIDILLQSHLDTGADFSYFEDAPLGTRPEIITTAAIKKLKSLIDTSEHSEYLSLYFKNNSDVFAINKVNAPEQFQCPQYRLNMDYPEDYEVLKKVFEGLKVTNQAVSLSSAIDFLEANPEVATINADIQPKYKSGEFAEFINKITIIK